MANPTPTSGNLKEVIHQTLDYSFLSELKNYCEFLWPNVGTSDRPYTVRNWFRELNKKSFSISGSLFYSDHDGGFTPTITGVSNSVLRPWFKQGASVGNLSTTYTEYSGLSRSTKEGNKNYIWAIEDGATAYVLAINRNTAALAGKWTLSGVTTTDVEDVTTAAVGGVSYIWVADVGDNGNSRSTIKIIRVVEPTVTGSDGTVPAGDIQTITCQYPAGDAPSNKDVECIIADPDTGDIYLITKRISPIKCYKLTFAETYSGTQTLEYMGNLTNSSELNIISTTYTGNNGYVTGGDISPNGNEIILRSYSALYLWQRDKNSETIYECLSRTYNSILTNAYVGGGGSSSITTAPKCLHPSQEPQGEAVAFDYEGMNLYTCSEYLANEGSSSTSYPLFKYDRLYKEPTVLEFQQGLSGYTGCSDTYIDSSSGAVVNSGSTSLIANLDYSSYPTINRTRQALLKFDLSSIPTNATVVGSYATLFVNTEGKMISIHKLYTGWTPESTYNSLNGGISLNNTDAAATPDCLIGVSTAGNGIDGYTGFLRFNIPVATAQEWVSTPSNNYGYVIVNNSGDTTGDGVQIDSSKSSTQARKPKLAISYTI